MPAMNGCMADSHISGRLAGKASAITAALVWLCACAGAMAQPATAPAASPLVADLSVALQPIEDRTHDMQDDVLGAVLARAYVMAGIAAKGQTFDLDVPAYRNMLLRPADYRGRQVRLTMLVYQAYKMALGAEGRLPGYDGRVWRLEGFNAAAAPEDRTSEPIIVYSPVDPSAVLGQPDVLESSGVARYDRTLPAVRADAYFYKLYRTPDTSGRVRDYPVAVAWQLAKTDQPDKGSPLIQPANILLLLGVLALVFVLMRKRIRRSPARADERGQYRPRRFEMAERQPSAPAGGEKPPRVVKRSGSQQVVTVALGRRSYDVLIGPGAARQLGKVAAALGKARQAVVIADSRVAELYGRAVMDSLAAADLPATLVDFPAGEEHKSLATYGQVFDQVLAVQPPVDRDALIVALGGGVTGDLAGFVAATALRGLRWIQCSTTLLADVDASVGGKTAVDHPAGKNLIGAFHQPSAVLIDTSVLKTLDARQIRTGLAECVKHGMIRDAELLDFIDDNAEAILAADENVMTELVSRNVAIKAEVVAADELEGSVRAHLNFGHTVGHAIETHLGLGKLTHGEAVSLGMVAETAVAQRRSLIDSSYAGRLGNLLSALGLPTRQDGLDAAAIWGIMQHDKKARGGRVRIVLPTGPGQVDIFDDIRAAEIAEATAALAK